MKPIENIDEIREAYESTLKYAAKNGREDFQCEGLSCCHCPFKVYRGSCTDPNVKGGAGECRTVAEWQQWWYELTGEEDKRTAEELPTEDGTEESTVTAEEPNVSTAGYEVYKEHTKHARELYPMESDTNKLVEIESAADVQEVKHGHRVFDDGTDDGSRKRLRIQLRPWVETED